MGNLTAQDAPGSTIGSRGGVGIPPLVAVPAPRCPAAAASERLHRASARGALPASEGRQRARVRLPTKGELCSCAESREFSGSANCTDFSMEKEVYGPD